MHFLRVRLPHRRRWRGVKRVPGGHRALGIMINQLAIQSLLKIDVVGKKFGQRSRRDVAEKTAQDCQPF